MVFDANFNGNGARYGALEKYLCSATAGGTDWGIYLEKVYRSIPGFPILHKLFGYGPDTFGILATRGFMGDMLEKTGLVFDTAHNEYIQAYLLTIGPIALLGYLVFLVGSCRTMVKAYSEESLYPGPALTGSALLRDTGDCKPESSNCYTDAVVLAECGDWPGQKK